MLSFCTKKREYILLCNHIWTQEMNKSSYLNGQERKLPVTKLEASLSNLYCYTGLLSEACEFITHVKQSINTTTTNNDNYNETFEMLANKALIRGKCATRGRSIRAEQQTTQGFSSASAARRKGETMCRSPTTEKFSTHVVSLILKLTRAGKTSHISANK